VEPEWSTAAGDRFERAVNMSGAAQSGGAGGSVSLGSLPIEQLESLETGMSNEVEIMQKQMAMLTDGVQRLQASKEGSEAVASMAEGTELMVPLTGSIYVPGTIKSTDAVLVDVGTGYYVEKNPVEAAEYFGRRAAVLKKEGELTASALTEKRQHLDAVVSVLERKKAIREMAAQQVQTGV
jgi:prefoldin alpha subunit